MKVSEICVRARMLSTILCLSFWAIVFAHGSLFSGRSMSKQPVKRYLGQTVEHSHELPGKRTLDKSGTSQNALESRGNAYFNLGALYNTTTRIYTLLIEEVNLYTYCNPLVDAVAINQSTPGPTLRARRGERLIVRVINGMRNRNTTIHWHGFSMHLNPASDGTPLLSQWPIAPGNFFDYSILVPQEWEAAGTYFYHTHLALQAMSAYGPLIIEDEIAPPGKNVIHGGDDLEARKGRSYDGVSPYKYDEDRVLMIMDYYGGTSPDNITRTLLGSPFIWPGSAHALPVNGKAAGAMCNGTALSMMNPPLTCPDPEEERRCYGDYAEIELDYDKTYRFRFIGSQSLMYVVMGLLYHSPSQNRMSLIEADGTYLQEHPIDEPELASGQRYSWLIHSKSQQRVIDDKAKGIYWLRLESRWRAGPTGWVRIVYPLGRQMYPNAASMPKPPYFQNDNTSHAEERLLHSETIGWEAPYLAPLDKYSEPAPKDEEVTRTVIIDGRQIVYELPGTHNTSLRWAQNTQVGVRNSGVYEEELDFAAPLLVTLLQSADTMRGIVKRSKSKEIEEKALCMLINCDLEGEKERAAAHKLRQGFDYQTSVFVAEPDEIIDIVLVNRPSALNNKSEVHPWHLHGSRHWVMAMGTGAFTFAAYEAERKNASRFANPILRDTSVVFSNNDTITDPHLDAGWTVIRHRTPPDFAGVYPLHCHLHFHLTMGMAVIWANDPEELIRVADSVSNATTPDKDTFSRWNAVLGIQGDGSVEGMTSDYLAYGRSVQAVPWN